MTEWIPCVGLDKLRTLLLIRALTNQFQAQPAIQTATVRTDKPDAWALLDSMSAVDKCAGELDLANTLAQKMYVRFGAGYNLSGGTTLSEADVRLVLAYNACGSILGTVTMDLVAPDTSTYHVPIAAWMSPQAAAKFRAGIVVTGATNGFKHKLTFRGATIEPASVTLAWGTDALDSFVTGDTERNSGDLAFPTTGAASIATKMWVQPGIGYSGSGAGAQATVTVVIGVRS
jgi:hypothetical protein